MKRYKLSGNAAPFDWYVLASEHEAECRERERAAFVAGVVWPVSEVQIPLLADKARAEALRRYGGET